MSKGQRRITFTSIGETVHAIVSAPHAGHSEVTIIQFEREGQAVEWAVRGPATAIEWRAPGLGLVGELVPRTSGAGTELAVRRILARVDVVWHAAAARDDAGATLLEAVTHARQLGITSSTLTADITAAGRDTDAVRAAWSSLLPGPRSREPWPTSPR